MGFKGLWRLSSLALLLLAAAAIVGPAGAQAGPCAAIQLKLKARGDRDGSLRIGEASKIILNVANKASAPLSGLGVKLALSTGLCPRPKATTAFPPLRPKHPALIEQAAIEGGFNIFWMDVALSGGKKRTFRTKATVTGSNATLPTAVNVEALVYLPQQGGGGGVVCSVAATPIQVRL
jgi:hypothetical protein